MASESSRTIIDGIHLDLLLEACDESSPDLASHWLLQDPLTLFQGIVEALLLCFTPLYATAGKGGY